MFSEIEFYTLACTTLMLIVDDFLGKADVPLGPAGVEGDTMARGIAFNVITGRCSMNSEGQNRPSNITAIDKSITSAKKAFDPKYSFSQTEFSANCKTGKSLSRTSFVTGLYSR